MRLFRKLFRFLKRHFEKLLVLLAIIVLIINDKNEVVAVVAGLTLMGTVAYLAVDRFIQKRKVQKLNEASLQAEIHMLKNQVNPHFFFNTLNNLYGLAVEKSDLAPEMILKLSGIMRYTIYEGEKDRVPIEDEIGYLKNFIELHKIRYHKSIDVKFNYMLEDDCKVPPLLFIVLLENAFKHGAETLTENAYIHLKLMTTKEQVYFEIKNNFDPEATKEKGIGLTNLQRRLQLLFPDQHALFTEVVDQNSFKAILKFNL